MDLSFDIRNSQGDHIMVALSYYDCETVEIFTNDRAVLTLVFYDVTLIRKSGTGYVNYRLLSAVSDVLAKFMGENEDAVLCFYCDADTDVLRNHFEISPQEYRSRLFSRMFDMYVKSHTAPKFINHRVEIEDPRGRVYRQYAHFICREGHEKAVEVLGRKLMQK